MAVVLQAGSLLAHLRLAGWRINGGWRGACVDADGLLRAVEAAPGPAPSRPQESLIELVAILFGERPGEVAGRGQARRSLRALLDGWHQPLLPLVPDEAVRQVLEAAPFLWGGEHAAARTALGAEHTYPDRVCLWVAGPGAFRRRMLRDVGGWAELRSRLASAGCRASWRELADVEAGAPPLDRARQLLAQGRFEQAIAVLDRVGGPAAEALGIACRTGLGRLGAARRALGRLERDGLGELARVELADTAVWLHGSQGRTAAVEPWLSLALSAERQPERSRAHLVAASCAWDRRDLEAMDRSLERARPALDKPHLAWRWRQIAALGALERGAPVRACHELRRAIGQSRRTMSSFEAASVWNDLAVARAESGDLAGAERAILHAVRLHERSQGPRRTTLALFNLAELRLRRGRVEGVRETLERSVATNLESGNWRALAYDRELQSRYELARGRPGRAVERVRLALDELDRRELDWRRAALHAISARALGWMGQERAAARHLRHVTEATGLFEPEELPALFALAGDRERALGSAGADPSGALWRAVLGTSDLLPRDWWELDRLDPYRAARLVADLELCLPGSVPYGRLRWAAQILDRIGNDWLADRLRHALSGAWNAIERYLSGPTGGGDELGELFRRAGHPTASLIWKQSHVEHEIVAGRGGACEIEAELAGGRVVLRAERIDGVLRTLFALVLRDWRPPRRPEPRAGAAAEGVVGESPALRQALDRARRLAPWEIPVLVGGESGTGKELVARLVHRHSARASGPFLPLNSAALSESLVLSDLFGHVRGAFTGADRDRAGVFEAARGGTVFLDELGDLPLQAQGMLLRVLQEGEVRRLGESHARRIDARVVAATHRSLDRLVAEGRFREDLFYRLAVGRVDLPALRDRSGDLDLLIEHFLDRFSRGRPAVLSQRAEQLLRGHSWPGNIRELSNCLAVAVALAGDGPIRRRHLDLPDERGRSQGSYHQQVLDLRRRLVKDALGAAGGNRAAAARRLGVSRQALSYLVRTLGLR